METMHSRLRDAREKAGFHSAAAAARTMGVTPSTYAAHENGQNEYDAAAARAYARKFRVRAGWLLTGESEDAELARQSLESGIDQPTVGSETGTRGIPADASGQLDVTAGMGAGGLTIIAEGVAGKSGMTFAAEHIRDYWRLPGDLLRSLGLRAHDVLVLPVQGDSMSPTLSENDFVFIDTRHRSPSPDGLYALLDEFGGVIVKRLELASAPRDQEVRVRVISDNPRHASKEWAIDDVRILGRVLRRFGVVG